MPRRLYSSPTLTLDCLKLLAQFANSAAACEVVNRADFIETSNRFTALTEYNWKDWTLCHQLTSPDKHTSYRLLPVHNRRQPILSICRTEYGWKDCEVALADCLISLHEHCIPKYSKVFIQIVRKTFARNTSVFPGKWLSGKHLSWKRRVRESD